MYGFTENYVKVETTYDPSLVNQLVNVQLEQVTLDQTVKIIIENP
jgi:hypothetical protein